ncbi:MAG: type II secretion system F family protein [Elusimicrobiales bacterium]|nr:type II secretion system F family protein [Elusimicrobiales bacterium]
MKKLTVLILLLVGGALAPRPAAAGVLTQAEMDEVSCAALKMQLFYYYLAAEKDPKILNYNMTCKGAKVTYAMPKWIETAVPEMLGRKVWRDPEEGEISEAALWQTPVSILYEYLELTRKTFPPEAGGANIQPGLLVKEYADIRIRFQMSMDRLYRARTRDVNMGDSMQGRGRTIMAQFALILKEMESIADAISSTNQRSYAEAVTASAVISQDSFRALFKTPRKYEPPATESQAAKVMSVALSMLGIILIFLAVQAFFAMNDSKTNAMMGDYSRKVEVFTEAFSRQFININVKYLVLGPAAAFAFLGLLTMNIFAFAFLSILGFVIGMRTPAFVLNTMKASRGRKIDAQLMDGLILLSNCLRSGLDIVQGFEMVSKDLMPPISDEFALVIKNYQLGMTFEKALGVLEERVESKMLSYMIRAIVLQRAVGGNLTKVFERIVIDIREESKLEEKTKAMTAQQKIQSIVVGIMPWVMVGVMFMFQPETMIKFYGSPMGMGVLFFCIIWISIGMKVVASLGKIRV